jgi:50S ribosomal protein L16 3-hydroxylase
MYRTLLGGLSPQRFLREYWQKRPLLVRQAVPGFRGFLSWHDLAKLASEGAQARLVSQGRNGWRMAHGPFSAAHLARRPRRSWTLLVQEVNHHVFAGWELLRRFSFIPDARLDDLMVSYAVPEGGVGPHVDSYDVFLLQGAGRRRWQISAQTDHTLVAGLPLKILKRFAAEQEWILEPGDMLYLPPHYAHCGSALSECFTYSIGFRAPATQELIDAFLAHLQDELKVEGVYLDPDLRLSPHAAEIAPAMLRKVEAMLGAIRWTRDDIAAFLGRYLTEPKPHVFFEPPRRALRVERFVERAAARGVRLDGRTLMLLKRRSVFMNGEIHRISIAQRKALLELADRRELTQVDTTLARALLYDWYVCGFLRLRGRGRRGLPSGKVDG